MKFKQWCMAVTAACFLSLGFQGVASATMIGTQELLDAQSRADQISGIQAALARTDVRDELVRLGVDPVAASERVASLSDAELQQVSGQIAELPAGGDGLLAVVGVVFVVLIILELMGVTDIFKKV